VLVCVPLQVGSNRTLYCRRPCPGSHRCRWSPSWRRKHRGRLRPRRRRRRRCNSPRITSLADNADNEPSVTKRSPRHWAARYVVSHQDEPTSPRHQGGQGCSSSQAARAPKQFRRLILSGTFHTGRPNATRPCPTTPPPIKTVLVRGSHTVNAKLAAGLVTCADGQRKPLAALLSPRKELREADLSPADQRRRSLAPLRFGPNRLFDGPGGARAQQGGQVPGPCGPRRPLVGPGPASRSQGGRRPQHPDGRR